MRRGEEDLVEVTIEFDHRELIKDPNKPGIYVVNWFDGDTKMITSSIVRFAVKSIAQALNDVAVLQAINPYVKKVGLKIM